jgi:hypothetical protein
MKYYLLRDDLEFSSRWFLGDVQNVDNWGFNDPTPYFMEPAIYTLDVYRKGTEMDYTSTEAFGVPVLSKKAKDALSGLPEIDEPYYHTVLEPVNIEGMSVEQDYFVMIIETQLDCVDEARSEFEKYVVDDPVRPDKAGQYSAFFSLVIDPEKVGDHHIFRVKSHLGSIIVSEEVKRRFEDAGVTGAVFESVNGDGQTVA